jgi:hypothetical protein
MPKLSGFHRLLTKLIAVSVLAITLVAQTEYKVTSVTILKDDGSLLDIEPTTGKIQQASSGTLKALTGRYSSKSFVEVTGARATARIEHASKQVFILKLSYQLPLGQPQTNLVGLANLQPMASDNKGNRDYVQVNMSGNMIKKGNADFGPGILGFHLTFTQKDESTIEVRPQEPLKAGEYAFIYNESNGYESVVRLHCFGVD